ncbi:MAG: hypothetical protein KGM24_10230, partial [Elusimicrobia bacterium]|nr:hypothetical protein [Elusimicrobiota bacterium]
MKTILTILTAALALAAAAPAPHAPTAAPSAAEARAARARIKSAERDIRLSWKDQQAELKTLSAQEDAALKAARATPPGKTGRGARDAASRVRQDYQAKKNAVRARYRARRQASRARIFAARKVLRAARPPRPAPKP